MAALAYSQCGNWQEVANSFNGLSSDRVRLVVRRSAETNEALRNAIDDGRRLSATRAREARKRGLLEPKKYLVRNDLALKRHHEIHEMRAATPSPVTLGQKMMGEPLPGRSALNKVETDGRGNIAKRKPIRTSIGAISIPDIRINSNGHHA
jgi:hypothetical protein